MPYLISFFADRQPETVLFNSVTEVPKGISCKNFPPFTTTWAVNVRPSLYLVTNFKFSKGLLSVVSEEAAATRVIFRSSAFKISISFPSSYKNIETSDICLSASLASKSSLDSTPVLPTFVAISLKATPKSNTV